MRNKLRLLSLLTGLFTVLGGSTLAVTSASAATAPAATASVHAATASAGTAMLTAAHPGQTVTLSASRSAHTVTVAVESGRAAPLVITMPAAPAIPNGFNCYFPTCGWEFSHAQTVGLYAGGTAAVLAACHHYLGPVGLTYLCDAIAGWVAAHLAPRAHQCLYVSTLPVGVIKYVSC
jgi:hypothetical protein